MWKTYEYCDLKGKIEVGDSVRAAKGRRNLCEVQLNNNSLDQGKITKITDDSFEINGCSHGYMMAAYLQLWEGPKTWADLKHGDMFASPTGKFKYFVIDNFPHCLVFTREGELDACVVSHARLEREGYRIIQPKESKIAELTVAQVAEKLRKHGELDGELKIIE